MISIYEPNISKYSKYAINAINTGWISNHGEYVEKATKKLKEFLNVKHCILMANGTCATHCLVLSLKHKFPDIKKIYVPNNCYVAAWNAVLIEYNKTNIEVMKMDIKTWNICTDETYIRSLETNSAVLIVHNLGNIINVPRLKRIRPDIVFIEDNCEGFTGKYEGIYSGTSESTLCSSISFYGNKIITTGEGGAFCTNDDDIYNYIRKVYSQGMSNQRYLHDIHAYNYRMTNIQAAFLLQQLECIDEILLNKNRIFNFYTKLFLDLKNVCLPISEPNTEPACWIYGVRINGNKMSIKDTVEYFKKCNVDIRPFFYPINVHKHLSDIPNNDETSFILNREIIMIPSSPTISEENQKYIVDQIKLIHFQLKIIEISCDNIVHLENFLKNEMPTSFRYYNKRNIDVIKNHELTVILMLGNIEIGYAHIDIDIDKKIWFGICVLEQYIGRGYGNHIMEYVLNHPKIIKLNRIYLSVDNDNLNAIKLYKNHNFVLNENVGTYSIYCRNYSK